MGSMVLTGHFVHAGGQFKENPGKHVHETYSKAETKSHTQKDIQSDKVSSQALATPPESYWAKPYMDIYGTTLVYIYI